jgi:hypothetical protein
MINKEFLGNCGDEQIGVMKMEYSVETQFDKNLIKQSTVLSDGDGVVSSVVSNIVRLEEQGVREALMKLGWTPPKDEETK